MRMGEVIGKLTLCIADEKLIGGRFLIVQPYDTESLRRNEPSMSEPLVSIVLLGQHRLLHSDNRAVAARAPAGASRLRHASKRHHGGPDQQHARHGAPTLSRMVNGP